MAATAIASRVLRLIFKREARQRYSMRSRRPTIGVAPGLACGSTWNTIFDDLNVAA